FSRCLDSWSCTPTRATSFDCRMPQFFRRVLLLRPNSLVNWQTATGAHSLSVVVLWGSPWWAARGCGWLALLDEGSVVEFCHGLTKLVLRVHDDRTIPGDWLFERFPRNQQKPNPLGPGLNADLVATVEQYERVIRNVVHRRSVGFSGLLSQYGSGISSGADW